MGAAYSEVGTGATSVEVPATSLGSGTTGSEVEEGKTISGPPGLP